MEANGLRRTIERLRVALGPDQPDEQLLQTFVALRDEAAFAALVRRHGNMVLGVSRRVLRNLHDSEDVFQATFLVLAQKARSVIKREAVASWLYKVAYRIALKAKTDIERRRQEESRAMARPQNEPINREWDAVLDEELDRLPAKYRLPIILCDLEGRTRKEVESQLGLAAGTLSSHLTRGRRMLAQRLSRRGIALSGGALATLLSQATASATVPSGLAGTTATAATLVAAGKLSTVSSSVTILMKAGIKAMFIAKLKAAVATLTLLGVVAFGASGLVYSGGGEARKAPSELETLRKENELLRVNLRVTLEKIQALESKLAGQGAVAFTPDGQRLDIHGLDAAIKYLRKNTPQGRKQAIESLDGVLKMLRDQEKGGPLSPDRPPGAAPPPTPPIQPPLRVVPEQPPAAPPLPVTPGGPTSRP